MIEVALLNKDHYKIEIIQSPDFEKDLRRISDLPQKVGVWGKEHGEEVFQYWKVPRVDVSEVRRRFKSAEILGDDKFWRDVKTWRRVTSPLDPKVQFKGHIDTGKIKKLYRRQDYYARSNPSRLRTLCDWPTGRGKTIAGLARAKVMGHKRIIIITVSSVFDDWVEDARAIFGGKVTAYVGKTKRQREKLREDLGDIVIAKYENAFELPVDWEHYIFDEADMISNPETLRYERLIPLINATWKGKRGVQVLTATPIGNTPSTAWTLFNLIHPLCAGSRNAFRLRFEKYFEIVERSIPTKIRGKLVWIQKRETKQLEFQNKALFLKKMAAFVVQLPEEDMDVPYEEKIEYIPVDMTQRQKRVYEDLKNKLKAHCGRRTIKIKEARTAALRLQQAAEGLFHFDEKLIKESGKLIFLVKLLNRLKRRGSTKKLIVWSRFLKLPEILHKLFPNDSVLYTGKLNHEQKLLCKWSFNGLKTQADAQEFQRLKKKYNWPWEPGECNWWFGTMSGSTGRGMNLQACALQYVTSVSLSGRVLLQNLGRIRRASTKHKLLFTRFIHCVDSADYKWIEYVNKKMTDMNVSAAGVEQLTADHLRELARMT